MNRTGDFKVRRVTVAVFLAIVIGIIVMLEIVGCSPGSQSGQDNRDTSSVSIAALFKAEHLWTAPDTTSIPQGEEGKMIAYGRTLVIHTSKYFGPNGSLAKITNGMNCQNCHLDAGTRPYGNNLAVVSTIYPKISPRSGNMITIADKVNECLSRSMNGAPIDTAGKEMQAYVAYIKWLGRNVKKGETLAGTAGIKAPDFISRAADPDKGKLVYDQFCARCHGADGQGQLAADVLKDPAKQQGGAATAEDLYYYPPLWGSHSFNGVATLYRLSKFAGFVQNNMPYPANHSTRVLTEEQAWDVAAYVNSRERPIKDFSKDYAADISKKPYDFPFPPYADNFTEAQHKFGPYTDMASAKKKAH